MLLLLNFDRPEHTEIDVYLKFDQLDNGDVVELLSGLDRLHKEIFEQQFTLAFETYYPELFYPFKNILAVQSIDTGQSIRFRFKEGWKFKNHIKKKALHISVPKNLGVAMLSVYFLLTGAQKIAETRNLILDGELKRLEIQLKQIEIYRRIGDQNLENKDEVFRRLQRQADKTIEFLYYNNSINHVEINGLTIKREENN